MRSKHCLMVAVELGEPEARSWMCEMLRVHQGYVLIERLSNDLAVVFLYPGLVR